MSAPETQVGVQTQHLLELVRLRREKQCNRVRGQASNQARQIIRNAYQEAHNRARQDILELRELIRIQQASAQARAETRRRHARQQADRELIDATWQPLRAALLRRWQQPAMRREWISTLVHQASRILIDPHWNIEHPPDWPLQECNDLKARLSNDQDCFPDFAPRPAITAGLCLCAGGACVDGTLDGLLRGRTRIEALLLAAIRKRRGADG